MIERFGEGHVHFCFGWQTATVRDAARIVKTHANDAAVIAGSWADFVQQTLCKEPYPVTQYRRHERSLVKAQKE